MKMKKVVAMVSALAMVAGLCTSAAADEAATDSDLSEHVEITIGGINMGSSDTKEGWPNEVVQKLEDKFNVTLSLKTYDNESIGLCNIRKRLNLLYGEKGDIWLESSPERGVLVYICF